MGKINTNQAKFSDVQELRDSGNRIQELLVYLFAQKHIISGMVAGAIKG